MNQPDPTTDRLDDLRTEYARTGMVTSDGAVWLFSQIVVLRELLAARPACSDPIECSHEAALGEARQEVRRLGLTVSEYGQGASALTDKLRRARELHCETCPQASGEAGPAWGCRMCELLDAPAAPVVPPAPTSRAAVLREAATIVRSMDSDYALQEAAEHLDGLATEDDEEREAQANLDQLAEDLAAAVASCPGRELSPSPCRCPCYGCKHHCAAHDPSGLAAVPAAEEQLPLLFWDEPAGVVHEDGRITAWLSRAVSLAQSVPGGQLVLRMEDAARLRRALTTALNDAAEGQPESEPGDDLDEDYLRFVRGQGPEPDLSNLTPSQRQAATGRFEIVRALADRDPELPPLDRDPVALRLGLCAAEEQPSRSDVGTEFVQQLDHVDGKALDAVEADLAADEQPGDAWDVPDARPGTTDHTLQRVKAAEEQPEEEQPENETPDTLPEWLYQRWASKRGETAWSDLDADDRSYWEHEAAAVRRAVARNGFKSPAVVPQPEEADRVVAHVLAVHTDLQCLTCAPPPWGDIWTPVTAGELEDGGICSKCGVDVLITPPAVVPHTCRNCEGIAPDTCLMNPDRPREETGTALARLIADRPLSEIQAAIRHLGWPPLRFDVVEDATTDTQQGEPQPEEATAPETVHACPPDGSGLTPCCGRTPFELPLGDRISSEAPVTCAGAAVQPGKEA